ncbi:MAG TPA: radical SAM protein [Bacillota bacterium]|nr:radical SAM protein [Bacillota bacterium]
MENIYSEKIRIIDQRTIDDFTLSILGPSNPARILWHTLQVNPLPLGKGLVAESNVNYNGTELRVLIEDNEITDSRYSEDDWQRRSRELVRRVVLEILKIKLPWGILTGVRPSKLYHMFRRKGFSAEEVEERLLRKYLLESKKAALLREVGETQQPFIQGNSNEIGVYIGIPFCPTRCRYCSFASHPLTTHGHLVAGFLEALLIEVEWAVQFCQKVGWTVGSIYIGGGTPTTLSPPDFQRIFSKLANLPKTQNMEFTVEAGRPETITEEHLAVFNEWGVNRISVNPQTMQ